MAGNGIQVEEGNFTRIHNTILERLARVNLNGSEFRCLMFLFRQTYGYGKKEDKLSMGQWAEGTGLDKRQTIRTLRGLEDRKYVYAIDNGPNRAKTYGFNKYFWEAEASGESTTSEAAVDSDKPTTSLDQSGGESTTTLPQTSGETVTKLVVNLPPTKERKKNTTTSSPGGEGKMKEPTDHQRKFAKVCEIVGWDFKTLDDKGKGQVAQAVGFLDKGEPPYTLVELDRFWPEIWVKDPRWSLYQKYPTLTQFRQEVGKVRATIHTNGHGPPGTNGKVEYDLTGVL